MNLEIWTDGACKGNGKKNSVGGYAYLIKMNDQVLDKFSAARQNTTNNQMELMAVIKGIIAVERNFLVDDFYNITIYSDSAYMQRCWEEKWYRTWQRNGWVNASKQPVKNKELWEQLIPYFDDPRYTFTKVDGHSGVKYNEIVDTMATSAADRLAKELK